MIIKFIRFLYHHFKYYRHDDYVEVKSDWIINKKYYD